MRLYVQSPSSNPGMQQGFNQRQFLAGGASLQTFSAVSDKSCCRLSPCCMPGHQLGALLSISCGLSCQLGRSPRCHGPKVFTTSPSQHPFQPPVLRSILLFPWFADSHHCTLPLTLGLLTCSRVLFQFLGSTQAASSIGRLVSGPHRAWGNLCIHDKLLQSRAQLVQAGFYFRHPENK